MNNTLRVRQLPDAIRVSHICDVGSVFPSFFIRFRDPIEALTPNWNFAWSHDGDLVRRILRSTNILVVQRSMDRASLEHMRSAKASLIPVIYETDDLMLDLPEQSNFKVSDEQKSNIREMLAIADLVTCSTEPLAERLREHSSHVTVIENYAIPFPLETIRSAQAHTPHVAIVNTDYFKLIDAKRELFVALQQAIAELKYRVSFFGSLDPEMRDLKKDFPNQVELIDRFIPSRRAFLSDLLRHGVNTAVVPLQLMYHHRFKSDIKYFDYASIGVPGIFNNSSVYGRVIHRETGYMCDGSCKGWLEALKYFSCAENRRRCGEAAHAGSYQRTLETYAQEFAEILINLIT